MRSENEQWSSVSRAFGKQSFHFDQDDFANPVLHQWRQQVYAHVDRFIKPGSRILELNAGTGIDAVRFAKSGHTVHATDLSDGMIAKLNEKAASPSLVNRITVQQVSFEHLEEVSGKFDYVFSNFGGLNCTNNLIKITNQLPQLLTPSAFVTWVIMPPVCPWELTWILKGKFKKAFRRLNKKGAMAHLEGEFFMTYYYSLSAIEKAFHDQFEFIKSEGLGIFSPPPAAVKFIYKHPRLAKFLNNADRRIQNHFPFSRWGDHILVTFQLKS